MAKDGFYEAGDHRPFFFTLEHQPNDVLRPDNSKDALKGTPFDAPSLAVKEGVQGVIGGAVAVGATRIRHLPQFVKVGAEVAVLRQKLGEIIIYLTYFPE